MLSCPEVDEAGGVDNLEAWARRYVVGGAGSTRGAGTTTDDEAAPESYHHRWAWLPFCPSEVRCDLKMMARRRRRWRGTERVGQVAWQGEEEALAFGLMLSVGVHFHEG